MSLPLAFNTSEDYFEESLNFFKKYQNLFNFSNTDILVLNILDLIDCEQLKDVNVFDKEFDLFSQSETNSFFKEFFEKVQTLSVVHEDFCEDLQLESKVDVPLSPKKKHEIVYLAKEIKEVCQQNNCEIVVDFGSGLGYLDQLINETTNLKVLGLECNENYYVNAKKRQRKYHINSIDNVKYIKHTVNENSDSNIKEYLNDKFENSTSVCITGLHACADLTVNAVNLFLKMADVKSLIVMPCCYHKMAENSEGFQNFPLSKCFRTRFEENSGNKFMRIPFLRLAAQPPSISEPNLKDSVFNLLARATLQLYARKYKLKLKRKKRKAVRTKTLQNDFLNYLQNAITGFALTHENHPSVPEIKGQNSEAEFDLEELQQMWRETQKIKVKAAIFILLQNYLQPLAENLVLYDRLVYLKENGVTNCIFKKICNEKISPRCLALLSIK